jgi:hypothetical protein
MAGFIESLFDPSELYQTLKSTNLLPDWAQQLPYSGATGEYWPTTNRMIANAPDNDIRRNTTAHELTHAVQDQLLKATASDIAERKWNQKDVSPQEDQYLRATSQLYGMQFGRGGQYNGLQAEQDRDSLSHMFRGLYKPPPDADPYYNKYRTRPNEAQAFGVGDMSGHDGGAENLGAHLNPSMATDFSILLNMYKQLPQGVRDSSAAKSQAAITENRLHPTSEDEQQYQYKPSAEAFASDPFLGLHKDAELQTYRQRIKPLTRKMK